MKNIKFFATFVIISLCVGSIHGARFIFGPKGKVTFDQRILSRSQGSPNAPVWIVEYMDYQCPACQKAFFIMEAYLKEYPSRIHFQVRFHPLKQHSHGPQSALYAECAAKQKKFWPFHRILFESQKEWETEILVDDRFHDYAEKAGLNLRALDACLAEPITAQTVEKENTDSLALGVNQTPTFFVNGKMIAGLKGMTEELKKLFPDLVLTDKKDETTSN